ncbi:hypothetical protein HK107_07670 [Parvularcula sp. ZS-1/3]|uniref:Lipoprotein n=1 Tax=Parvularcula mediterranea TaxID=2732508 RepID=A0A7Y3RMB0_9PROT|nr:hypothetical protein [Parvularcula mediterranea]NNU16196.1 hypothetical protein [Parvularcula mediterranea]
MRQLLLAAAAATLIAACATTPEPCTRAYFVYKSDELQREFAQRNRGEVRRLRTLREDLNSQPDLFTALAVLSAKRDVERLVLDLRNRVIPDARFIANECGIDGAFDIMVDGFLVKQGIDPQLVRTLGLMELFEEPAIGSTLQPAQ